MVSEDQADCIEGDSLHCAVSIAWGRTIGVGIDALHIFSWGILTASSAIIAPAQCLSIKNETFGVSNPAVLPSIPYPGEINIKKESRDFRHSS